MLSCVCMHEVFVSHVVLQREEKQNEMQQPCGTWQVENERVGSGGVGATWSSSLLFSAQGPRWWSQAYCISLVKHLLSQTAAGTFLCMFSGEFNGRGINRGRGWWRPMKCQQKDTLTRGEASPLQQFLFIPPTPHSCRATLWGQKRASLLSPQRTIHSTSHPPAYPHLPSLTGLILSLVYSFIPLLLLGDFTERVFGNDSQIPGEVVTR